MKKLKIIEGWGFENMLVDKTYLRSEDLFKYVSGLLQQQAELTRAETIKEIVDIIEKYKLFAEDLHRGAHRDNLNMLLYDSHSRIVACDHILEKINLLTQKSDEK